MCPCSRPLPLVPKLPPYALMITAPPAVRPYFCASLATNLPPVTLHVQTESGAIKLTVEAGKTVSCPAPPLSPDPQHHRMWWTGGGGWWLVVGVGWARDDCGRGCATIGCPGDWMERKAQEHALYLLPPPFLSLPTLSCRTSPFAFRASPPRPLQAVHHSCLVLPSRANGFPGIHFPSITASHVYPRLPLFFSAHLDL